MKRNTFLKSLGLLAAGIVSGNKIFGDVKKNHNVVTLYKKKVEDHVWRIHAENEKRIEELVGEARYHVDKDGKVTVPKWYIIE